MEEFGGQVRGADVTRVLLLENEQSVDEKAKGWIEGQLEAGIEVLIAFTETLSDDLIADFAIYDDKCVVDLHFAGVTSRIQRANYYSSKHPEFARYQSIRRELLRHTEQAHEVLTRIGITRGT